MATTYVSTIKAADGDYTTWSACEAGRQAAHASGDISAATGDDSIEEWVCYSLDDTTAVAIRGWTTAAGNYIYVHADSSARHAGIWNGDKYNLVVANSMGVAIDEEYVRIDGLQMMVSPVNGNQQNVVSYGGVLGVGAANEFWLSNCIIRGASDATYHQRGVDAADADCVNYIWNCIIYGMGTFASSSNSAISSSGTAVKIYSTVGIGGYYGLRCAAGTLTAKNCYFGGSGGEDYYFGAGTFAKTTCASEDASADDTGATETQSGCLINIALGTDTFVNVTAGSEDFHLAADGLSPLQGVGADTSGDAAPMNFTTDIDEDARDATWDIGADAVVTGGAYTLVCATGSFAESGIATTLLKTSKIVPDAGSFVEAGIAAGLLRGYKSIVESGTFTKVGIDANLLRGFLISSLAGTIVLSGTVVDLIYSTAKTLAANGGTLVISGQAINALKNSMLAIGSGGFAESGTAANLFRGRQLSVDAGAIVLAGQIIDFIRTYKLTPDTSLIIVVGKDATLTYVVIPVGNIPSPKRYDFDAMRWGLR